MKTRTTASQSNKQEPSEKAQESAGKTPGVFELLSFGSQALLKQAIEEEITNHLGREKYERLKADEAFRGERNGYRVTTIDTPIGALTYDRPRVTGAPDFKSAYHAPHMRRPEEFADQVAEMYVTGVSTRKVKKALKAVAGDKIKLSRSTVSRITQRLRDEYTAVIDNSGVVEWRREVVIFRTEAAAWAA